MKITKAIVLLLSLSCVLLFLNYNSWNNQNISVKKMRINNMDPVLYKPFDDQVNNSQEMSHSELQNVVGKREMKEVDNAMPIYTDVKQFLRSTPENILKAKPPNFITDMRNPCFALEKNFINVGNITLANAVRNGYEIRCLPYAFQAGFAKCGTIGLFYSVWVSRYVMGGTTSKGLHWRAKEIHYWDNHNCADNYTMDGYSRRYQISNGTDNFGKTILNDLYTTKDYMNFVFIDGTPRTLWHGDTWQADEANKGLVSPSILMQHKLYHVLPHAKITVVVRNPSARLFSDYKYYYHGKQTPEDFHKKVVDAIGWWNICIQLYPLKTCAYGQPPSDLPRLAYFTCIDVASNLTKKVGECYQNRQWNDCRNSANRLRVGMYDIFLKDWMEVYPKESFLVIRLEDFAKAKLSTVENQIIPFLELPQLTEDERDKLHRKDSPEFKSNATPENIKMLPSTRIILDKFYTKSRESLASLLEDEKFLYKDFVVT